MKRWLVLATALALILGIGVAVPGLAQTPTGQARLRAVNTSPDAPPLNLLVDNSVFASNLPFKGVTPYSAVSAGSHTLQWATVDASQTLTSTTATLDAGTDHTMIAVGRFGSIQQMLLTDDNTLPGSGQARVRFVNTSPDASPLDLAVTGGGALFSGIPFQGVGNYITVNSGTVSLDLRITTTTGTTQTVSTSTVTLNERSVYTIFAVGLLNGQPSLQILLTLDASAAATATASAVSVTPTASAVSATPSATTSLTPATAVAAVSVVPSVTPTGTQTATSAVTGTATTTATATGSATPGATGTASATAATATPGATSTPVSSVTGTPTSGTPTTTATTSGTTTGAPTSTMTSTP